MKKNSFALLFLILIGSFHANMSAQNLSKIQFNELKLRKIEHSKIGNGVGYGKTEFSFSRFHGEKIKLSTFGISNFENLAVLGIESACVCVGDRISFTLIEFELDSAKSKIAGLRDPNHFVYRCIKISNEADNRFEYLNVDSIPRGIAPQMVGQENIVVIFEERLYLLSVHGNQKYFNIHNQCDRCKACQEILEQI